MNFCALSSYFFSCSLFPIIADALYKKKTTSLTNICDRLVDELSIWLNERVNERKEEKNMYCTLFDLMKHIYTRKSLTLVVTDGCWPPLLNKRASIHIMYKLIERARKKSLRVCSHDCIVSGWPWSKREGEKEKK